VLVGYGVAEEDEPHHSAAPAREARERRGPVPASPPVRRLAKELGIELADVAGTGPGGRVTREDIQNAAASATSAPSTSGAEPQPTPTGRDERVPVRGVRRLVAEKMARS